MMTQADVFSESMNVSEKEDPAATSAQAAKQRDPVVLSPPNLVQTEYQYNQNAETLSAGQNVQPRTETTPIQPIKYFAKDSAINSSKGLRNIIIGGMIFSGLITVALIIQIALGTNQVPYRIGIVTQEKVCSDIGAEMVHMGGKSIDAFIASSLCLSVVSPFSAGPGAGGFLLIRDHKHDKNLAVNCFFKSSDTLDKTEYADNPVSGKASIGIPGEFSCISEVYKYAKFNWKRLTRPAINLAQNGFKVTKHLVRHLEELDFQKDIVENTFMAEIYLKDGKLVKENDVIKNMRLARTLEKLRDRPDDLYVGSISDSIVEDSKLTKEDLSDYRASTNDVAKTIYNGFVVLSAPFPSNGPIVGYTLRLMKTLNLKIDDFKKSEFFTNLLQASSMGYKMSAYAADPASTTVKAIYEEALDESIKYFKALVNGNKTASKDPFLNIGLDEDSYKLTDDIVTSFISVNDHNDLMISYTGTLGSAWGSRVMSRDGFMLNNAMNFFSYGPSNANENNNVEGGKQPRALFTPLLAYNEKNPCVRRFSVSYSHHGESSDDFGLTELTEVLLKLFTDYSLYETAIQDKRVQYNFEKGSCFEQGFDSTLKSEIKGKNLFTERMNCTYHGIDMIMKKDHIIYSKVDSDRSMDSAVTFNK